MNSLQKPTSIKVLWHRLTSWQKRTLIISLIIIDLVTLFILLSLYIRQPGQFSGSRAYADVEYQISLGPRIPGSSAHAQLIKWATREFENAGWQTSLQISPLPAGESRNLIASRGSGLPWVIIGAHYDSRFFATADPDPKNKDQAVPGANDGASGVAVLLELARTLPEDVQGKVWLVLLDAEDQGQITNWDWIMGSRALAASLTEHPDAVIIIDMIGDKDLNIYKERNSDVGLTNEIWDVAASLGYDEYFIPEYKFQMLDDHIPFIEKGIKAADLIDFDYPHWHTIEDTADKVSPKSLEIVGQVLTEWLKRR